jgi:uncharacterized membrane protein YhhN
MTIVLIVAAIACVIGEYMRVREIVYFAKPLATIAVILIAAGSTAPVSTRYRALITIGLFASLTGDVLLMLPEDWFLEGLVSFLVAHLLYITAFAGEGGGLRDAPVALVMALIGAAMLALLWPGLGNMRIPVTAYVVVIAMMAWQAVARWRHIGGTAAAMAAVGALSFMISDAALAVQRFRVEFPLATIVVLGSYWAAQWGIAQSVRRDAVQATSGVHLPDELAA